MFEWRLIISTLILSILSVFPFSLFSQNSIEKNEHVKYSVDVIEGSYLINYTFKDHFNNLQTYELTIPAIQTQQLIEKFGIPLWLFEPYADNPPNRIVRQKEISKGLFRLNENVIEVDKSAVLAYYSKSFAKPIAEMIVSSLNDYGADNKRNRVEFAMRFIQDIPYGIPDYKDKDRHYGGVNVPPKLIIDGFGDCDSKALLFVGILSYLIPTTDIIFLNQKDHVLTAIKEKPEKGLTYVKFKGKHYLVAETAGPGKRLLGERGNYYRDKFTIETLKVDQPDVIPYADNNGNISVQKVVPEVDDNTLLIKNESSKTFRFQMSYDQRKWDHLSLNPRQSGQYIFNQKVDVFIRFRINRNKYSTLQVQSGKSYTIYWNEKRRRWEIAV